MSRVKVIEKTNKGISIQVNIKFGKSMLETENKILECLNEAGQIATGEALVQFDADGIPVKIGDQIFYSKGEFEKNYQTPYGETRVLRHVYQSKSGGKIFCPLNHDARLVITSTPRFAKMISSKYSFGSTESVKKDLNDNHGRSVNRKTLQTIVETVAKSP